MAKITEVQRQNAVSVADYSHESKGLWPYEGAWITIVTAAPIFHGRLVAITPCDYVLDDASWVVDTGRLSEYVLDPNKVAKEAEFIGTISIPRGSVLATYKTEDGQVKTR